ncbi:MAG TPA: hypothetical protein VNR11_19450 [Xanthobacteraceae bacterium]|nr:hypothetical protein [Xanthobacteraceae bacterium]
MTSLSSYLEGLKADAERASTAERSFRSEIAARIRELEQQRAFAFRRLNLMRAIGHAVSVADSEEAATAGAAAALRERLGWSSDSEARAEVVARFTPVARAMFAQFAPTDGEGERAGDVAAAMVEFEAWYAATHPVAFWVLFENVMPETPVVDF